MDNSIHFNFLEEGQKFMNKKERRHNFKGERANREEYLSINTKILLKKKEIV